jgi:hypothetical protein
LKEVVPDNYDQEKYMRQKAKKMRVGEEGQVYINVKKNGKESERQAITDVDTLSHVVEASTTRFGSVSVRSVNVSCERYDVFI